MIGVCNLRGNEGLFRLGLYQGYLTIHKQQYPAELNQYDRYYPNLEGAVQDKAVEASRKVTEGFDAADYVNKVAERLAKVTAGGSEDSESTAAEPRKEINMLEALEMFGS